MKLLSPSILCRFVACLTLLLISGLARAQPEEGAPIDSGDFAVDASQGPITGSTRVIGLGGAFVAIAAGADGTARNPAAVAVRLPHSWHVWDYNRSIDFGIASWLPESDFLNTGAANDEDTASQAESADVEQRSLLFASLALNVYREHAGVGFAAEGRRQALQRQESMAGLSPTKLSGNFGVFHASVGYGFAGGQLVVGAGPRITGLSISARSRDSELISAFGVGAQVGAVLKPTDEAWRAGAAYKSAVTPGSDSDDQPVTLDEQTSLWRPEKVTLPWEVALGFAWQFGPRPLNPEFVSAVDDGDDPLRSASALKKRYLEQPRRYFLVSSELLLIGTTDDTVSLASAIEGTARRSGEQLAWSPRLGIESEVVPHRLTLRAGCYREPSRIRAAGARLHGTFGFDLKLVSWDVFGILTDFDEWTISSAIDGTDNYLNTSFSIGIWH